MRRNPICKMEDGDLLELYVLLDVFSRVYDDHPDEVAMIMRSASTEYQTDHHIETELTRSEIMEIAKTVLKNPRNAGAKRKYSKECDNQIQELRSHGMTIRDISKKMQCSYGYVQSIVSG